MSTRTVSQPEQLELFNIDIYRNYCENCGVVETVIPGIYCDGCCEEIIEWLEAAWGDKL